MYNINVLHLQFSNNQETLPCPTHAGMGGGAKAARSATEPGPFCAGVLISSFSMRRSVMVLA